MKRSTKQMKRTRLNPKGKKVKEWDRTRAKLKIKFHALEITRCEVCGSDDFLTFAHSRKRRHIDSQELLEDCALLCQTCHWSIEKLGEEKMRVEIEKIISQREAKLNRVIELENYYV